MWRITRVRCLERSILLFLSQDLVSSVLKSRAARIFTGLVDSGIMEQMRNQTLVVHSSRLRPRCIACVDLSTPSNPRFPEFCAGLLLSSPTFRLLHTQKSGMRGRSLINRYLRPIPSARFSCTSLMKHGPLCRAEPLPVGSIQNEQNPPLPSVMPLPNFCGPLLNFLKVLVRVPSVRNPS